jgi:hypothetical protein
VRRWLRLLPLAALTLGLTWSGARASGDEPTTPQVEATQAPALALPPVIAGRPARTQSPDFAFTNVRRF